MSMSTHAVGFKPADEKWNQMKAIWDMCERNLVTVPDEVSDFFDGESPGDKPGMEVPLGGAIREYSDANYDGYEIDISKLPADVRFLRVYNSW